MQPIQFYASSFEKLITAFAYVKFVPYYNIFLILHHFRKIINHEILFELKFSQINTKNCCLHFLISCDNGRYICYTTKAWISISNGI